MAFLESGWGKTTTAFNQPIEALSNGVVIGAPTFYTYQSAVDNIATIGGVDYFASKAFELSVGDVIYSQGSDSAQLRSVTALTTSPASVTTSALSAAGAVGTANLDNLAVTTAKIAANAVTYAKEDVGVIATAIVTLTANQIKALRATPITLVAAPGASLALELIDATLALVYNTTAYTVGGGNDFAIRYTDGAGVIVSQTIETTGFMDQVASTTTRALPKVDPIVAKAAQDNKALVIHNIGGSELTLGDSTVVVKIRYYVSNNQAAFT